VFCAGDVGDASAAASLKPARAMATQAELATAAQMTGTGKGDGHWTELELKYIFDMLLKNSDEATRKELAQKFKSFMPPPGGGQPHTNFPYDFSRAAVPFSFA
jgi:hypothetical protein